MHIKFSTKREDLQDHIAEIYKISCELTTCNNEDETDEYEGYDYFFEKGWREWDGNAICPSCVRKIKKAEKKK